MYGIVFHSMQLKKPSSAFTVGTLGLLILLSTFIFFTSKSPFDENGSVIKENILVGSILLGVSIFIIFHFCFLYLFKTSTARKLSGVMAFSVIEILLLGSLSLVNLWSILAALAFNIIGYWYLFQRLNKR